MRWETNYAIIIDETEIRKIIHQHEYFSYFQFCLDDFHSAGNMSYGPNPKLDYRGGWPYYLPILAQRFGLKVTGEYDEGNDDWLKMNGNEH